MISPPATYEGLGANEQGILRRTEIEFSVRIFGKTKPLIKAVAIKNRRATKIPHDISPDISEFAREIQEASFWISEYQNHA